MVKDFNKTFVEDSTQNEGSKIDSKSKSKGTRGRKRESEKTPNTINSYLGKKENPVNIKRKSAPSEETKGFQPVKKQKLASEDSEPTLVLSDIGKYECGDRVKSIISAKKGEDGLMFYVDWLNRANGNVPFKSYVSNKDIKRYDPELLIEFYETKISFKGADSSKTTTTTTAENGNNLIFFKIMS